MIQDARVRNAVEGKIGEGKRKYALGLIRGKLKETSETMIAFTMIAMNLARCLRGLFFSFFQWLLEEEIRGIRSNFEVVPGQNPHNVSQLLPS